MQQTLDIATQTLLEPASLQENQLDQVMGKLLSRQVDLADIFFQYSKLESWILEGAGSRGKLRRLRSAWLWKVKPNDVAAIRSALEGTGLLIVD